MIRSMTGYGKAESVLPDKKVIIEIKSLNSKSNDTSVKLPNAYRSKEIEIRQIIAEKLIRGKIDVSVNFELNAGVTPAVISKDLVISYYRQLIEINREMGISTDLNLLDVVMKLPDTVKVEKNEFEEDEWIKISEALNSAIMQVSSFRETEGRSLEKDILANVSGILKGLDEIPKFENARIGRIREKLYAQIRELNLKDEIDNNRLEQELIYYLEKMDVTEEKVRLKHHCDYFRETIHNEDNAGKKLGFIVQEMGREINTLGSKASDPDMQKIVVGMKDDLEKVKEQILNIL